MANTIQNQLAEQSEQIINESSQNLVLWMDGEDELQPEISHNTQSYQGIHWELPKISKYYTT